LKRRYDIYHDPFKFTPACREAEHVGAQLRRETYGKPGILGGFSPGAWPGWSIKAVNDVS
jgi:hypothetical protein